MSVPSPACDAVLAAAHPSSADGGPCATCAFSPGTQANQAEHTMELARLCVEGFRTFSCHEQPQLCRGFIAAINLRGVPQDEDDRRWCVVAGDAADFLSRCIDVAKQAEGPGTPPREPSQP